MTIDDKNRDEKLQYDINRKIANISALSSGKIDKYEYLTGKETLPSDQERVIYQVKFSYSPLEKAFEKQTKTMEEQGKTQIKIPEELGKQLVESNELVKDDFNIAEIIYHLKKKKINELVEEICSGFRDLQKKPQKKQQRKIK